VATQAQRDLVALKDPIVYKATVATNLDAALDLAAIQLARSLYRNQFDLAVALAAICTLRRTNPNIGGGALTAVGESAGGSRTKSPTNMPPGYPANWYTCPAGEELIGITTSLTPPTFG